MTWCCVYVVAMPLHSSSHRSYMFINHHVVLGACAEDHDASEAPQGMTGEVGVHLRVGGPIRRTRRRRGSRS
jgi:hypothetical protein